MSFAVAMMDNDNHQQKILHSNDPYKRRQPASLTKIMTLRMIFKALEEGKITPNTTFRVSKLATVQIPSKSSLKEGDYLRVRDAIGLLVTKSANDVAVVVAEGLAGSVSNFVHQMNKEAKSIRMHHTIFQNASGTPNPNQLTNAYDMMLLGQSVYKDFKKYWSSFKTQYFHHCGQVYRNHNRMLGKVPGVDGIKTGYVDASKFNIVVSAQRFRSDGTPVRLFVVVMGGDSQQIRDTKANELLDYYFHQEGAVYMKNGHRTQTHLIKINHPYPCLKATPIVLHMPKRQKKSIHQLLSTTRKIQKILKKEKNNQSKLNQRKKKSYSRGVTKIHFIPKTQRGRKKNLSILRTTHPKEKKSKLESVLSKL
jgi:D-alanyl-D-alanine carboxypeptidase